MNKSFHYLGRSGDVRSRKADIWCPSDISDPVSVPLEHIFLNPCLRILSEAPDLDKVIASSTGEALHALWSRLLLWTYEGTRKIRGSP